jgi:hypothetical protein
MMQVNFPAVLVAAISSLVTGMIWYNPKVFGTAWMRASGVTMDENKKPNMAVMFLCTFIYAFFIAFMLQFFVIHQWGATSAAVPDLKAPEYVTYMEKFGQTYRTFKHGMLHGAMAGLFFALPVIGVGALYERRSFKYTLITGGYWVLTCMIMGGIICAWQ